MKMILGLLTLFFSFSGYSQSAAKDSSVNCVTYWRLGETRTYSIIHEKSSVNESGNIVPFRFAYLAQVSVIDSTSNSYTIKWKFQLPEEYKMMSPRIVDSLPVFNGMEMIYKVSEMGAFLELLNWEEVRDTYFRQMDMSMSKNRDSTAAATLAATKKMFSSKQMVEATFIKEIRLFHEPYGYKFTMAGASAETQLPNPFGGEPFPAHQIYKLTALDKVKNSFTLVFQLNIDKGNVNKLIDPILKNMNIIKDAEIDKAEKGNSYDLQDYSEYHVVSSTGWISRLLYKRTMSIGKTWQSDSFTIALKD
jgi:hypothetical protein